MSNFETVLLLLILVVNVTTMIVLLKEKPTQDTGASNLNSNKWHENSNNKLMHKEKIEAASELAKMTTILNKKMKELDGQGIYVYGEVRQDHPMTGRAPIVFIDVFNRHS